MLTMKHISKVVKSILHVLYILITSCPNEKEQTYSSHTDNSDIHIDTGSILGGLSRNHRWDNWPWGL